MSYSLAGEYRKLVNEKVFLENKLSALPEGYISKKYINGQIYYYLQRRSFGKIVSEYIKTSEFDKFKRQLNQRKKYEGRMSQTDIRINKIERAAKTLGGNALRELMVIRVAAGMDDLDVQQRRFSTSFAQAINNVGGTEYDRSWLEEQVEQEKQIQESSKWYGTDGTFLSLIKSTLKRHGFPINM